MDSSKILDEQGGPSRRKVFALNEFKGNRYFEIEEYYIHRGTREWKKKKGMTLNKDAFRILKGVVDRDQEEIFDWIGAGYVPEDVARYEELQVAAAEKNSYRLGAVQIGRYEEARDPCFFDVAHEGGTNTTLLNYAHPAASVITSSSEDAQKFIAQMLASFHKARLMLSESPALDANTVLMHLEQDWGKYLRDALRSSEE